MKFMRIQLENIGKIHQAQIDLNGITAIAEEIIRVKVQLAKLYSAFLIASIIWIKKFVSQDEKW